MSSNVKNSLLLIIEKVVLLSLGFINNILLARLAGPDLFGEFSYIVSFAAIFSPLAVMGLNNIITKYIVKYPANSHYYIKSALLIRLLGAIVSLAITTLVCLYAFNLDHQQAGLIIMLVAMQGFTFLYVLEFFYIAKKQVSQLVKLRLVTITLINIAKLIAIINAADLTTLIFLQGLETVLIGVCYYIMYTSQKHHQVYKLQPKKQTYLALYQKGKWLLFSGVAAVIYLKIDQIMLANLVNTEAVAYYAAAAKLSEFWYVFPVLIANVYTTQLSHYRFKHPTLYKQLLQRLILVLTCSAIILSLATWFFADNIIALIYGSAYTSSAVILSVHIFASLFVFQRAVLSKWLILEKLYKYSLLSNLLGAVVNILLNLLLIPKYQGLGAAWATIIAYMVASYGFLFINAKTREYAKVLHQAVLHSVPILINLIHDLKVQYEKHSKKNN